MNLPAGRKRILAEATAYLYAARIILMLFPLKRVINFPAEEDGGKVNTGPASLQDIKWGLAIADRLAVWNNRCIVSCIAGRWMLSHRGISSRIMFGVKHDEERRVIAHAWLLAGDFEVIEKGGDYIEFKVP